MNKDNMDRQIYVENRKVRLEEFRSYLSTPKNKYAKKAVARTIKDQKEFIAHIQKQGHKYTNFREEKAFLDLIETEAKKVFGKDYNDLFVEDNYE